jgi:hypothetical protein
MFHGSTASPARIDNRASQSHPTAKQSHSAGNACQERITVLLLGNIRDLLGEGFL